MVTIRPVSLSDGKLALGTVCHFSIEGGGDGVHIRAFLKREGVFYLKPLTDWTQNQTVTVFPEAPGRYTFAVAWRDAGGDGGCVECCFEVIAGEEGGVDDTPRTVTCPSDGRVWAPSEWEAGLLLGYEEPVLAILDAIIKPGWTVYDVGANLGVYSLRCSRLVGAAGHVYSLEANPVCVYFLHATFQHNRISNAEILPVAVLDRHDEVPFTINYSNLALGVTERSHLSGRKAGHEILVRASSLDDLVESYQLRRPNLVKIDIEGAEAAAVAGAARCIARYRPVFLIEVHGRKAALQTFDERAWHGYRFVHPASGVSYEDAAALLQWFPNGIEQILCLPAEVYPEGQE